MAWMVSHAASLLNRYQRDMNGRTPYRKLKGKEFDHPIMEFGEGLWYMKPGITGKHKMDKRWERGVWLGIRDRSAETIVGTSEGCLKVRSIRKLP